MIITIIAVLFLFVTSLVPISNSLSKDLSSKIPQDITDMAQLTTPFHLSNSYGLFRRPVLFSSVLLADLGYFLSGKTIYRPFFFSLANRMTTKRPELVVQWSNDGNKWTNYEFPYKPGSLDRALPFVQPHQPRLDWQVCDSSCLFVWFGFL